MTDEEVAEFNRRQAAERLEQLEAIRYRYGLGPLSLADFKQLLKWANDVYDVRHDEICANIDALLAGTRGP